MLIDTVTLATNLLAGRVDAVCRAKLKEITQQRNTVLNLQIPTIFSVQEHPLVEKLLLEYLLKAEK